MPSILTVEGLTKRFTPGARPVVEALGFDVAPGEVFALLGPSGCGKTTTLRLIAGFERADAGRVVCDGTAVCAPGLHIPPERRGVGLVFQDYALFPHLSVLENARFGLKGLPKREQDERARAVLARVGLRGYERRPPHQLSGGQQQRVALARALAPSPRLILLDEPFSNLDALLRQATRAEVRRLFKDEGVSAVLVTHDQEEALSFADRVAVMRAGRIEQIGTPEELYHRPRTLFVAQFLGPINLMPVEAAGTTAETPLGRLRLDRPARGPVLLALRPEHLALTPARDGEAGRVLTRAFKGRDITFRVDHGGHEYLVYTHNQAPYQPGDLVGVHAREPAIVLEAKPESAAEAELAHEHARSDGEQPVGTAPQLPRSN